MSNRQTHTYAVLSVSQSAYDEIRAKLKKAAYDHAFCENGIIDMRGIAIQTDNPEIGDESSYDSTKRDPVEDVIKTSWEYMNGD